LAALSSDPRVRTIVGIARRRPATTLGLEKVEWRTADVSRDDLVPLFRGADAVFHLAWIVQPSHDEATLQRVNVDGSVRVFDAVAAAGVPTLLYESSFGAYSPGPQDRRVDESWPTAGIPGSPYARQKAYVERVLDAFELAHPEIRVVRFRSAYTLKAAAGPQAHRLYGGPLVPRLLAHPSLVPAFPAPPGLRTQAVHTDDVARAYVLALDADVRGAFNLATEPVLDVPTLASVLSARPVRIPASAFRAAVWLAWRLHLQRTPAEWVDLTLESPLMDTTRARTELGWSPAHSATDAVREFLTALALGPGGPTPPLQPARRGPRRWLR
jgi:nucleoside-diphosphate-sugar epimerase